MIKFRFILLSAFFFLLLPFFASPQNDLSKLKNLSVNADVIAIGTVTQQKSDWDAGKTKIFTEAELQVSEIIKGGNAGQKLIIKYPGGEVDGIGEIYTHMPRFNKNEDVLMFLKKENENYRVYDGENGKISLVTKNGEKVSSSNVGLDFLKTQIKGYLNK